MSKHNILFSTSKKKITLYYPKSVAMGFFHGFNNNFETVVVNEPSMFEPLKVYCTAQFTAGIKERQLFKEIHVLEMYESHNITNI